MAVSHLVGFDFGSTAEAQGSPSANGAQTTIARHGYAFRANPSATTHTALFASRAAGGSFRVVFQSIRFYLRVATLPSANTNIADVGLAGAAVLHLRLNTTGTLSLMSGSTVRATSVNALSADGLFHRVDLDNGWSAGSGMRAFVDGTSWVTDSTDAVAPRNQSAIGVLTSTTADLYFDDIAFYDSALPATLNDYSVSLLLPAADSALGGWTDGAGGTSSLFGSVDNVPPVGVAASTAAAKIKSPTNSASDDYDATCAAYTSITGLTTQSQVLAVQSVCNDAQESTTGSPKAGAVVITSNPSGQTERSFDFGLHHSVGASATAANAGTFPVGWGTHCGPVTEAPTLTMGSGPTVRVGKRTATVQVVDVDFLGVYVMWQAATYSLVYDDRRVRRNSLLRR